MITCVSRPGSKRVRSRYRLEDPHRRERSVERARRAALVAIGSIFIFSFNVLGWMPAPLSVAALGAGGRSVVLTKPVKQARPVYPYSLIPGGVYSMEELRAALTSDPDLAAHYAGFDLDKARIVASDSARLMFSSYRKDGAIFWTRQPIHISQGEMLITDGVNWARARCGNRLSEVPQYPQGIDDLPEDRMDAPAVASGAPAEDFSDLPHPHLAFEVFPALVDAGDDTGDGQTSVAETRVSPSPASQGVALSASNPGDELELAYYFNFSLPINAAAPGPLDPSVAQPVLVQSRAFVAEQTKRPDAVPASLPKFSLPNSDSSLAYLLPQPESTSLAAPVLSVTSGSTAGLVSASLPALTSAAGFAPVGIASGLPLATVNDPSAAPGSAGDSLQTTPEASPALLAFCGLLLMSPTFLRARKSKPRASRTSSRAIGATPQPPEPESPSWDETVPWQGADRTRREPRL